MVNTEGVLGIALENSSKLYVGVLYYVLLNHFSIGFYRIWNLGASKHRYGWCRDPDFVM